MSNNIKVPNGFVESLQSARKGIGSNWPANTPSMRLQQQDLTQTALETKFDALITIFSAPGELAAQHADACDTRDAAYSDAHDFVSAFFQALPAYVGKSAAGLAPFGKAPPKQRTPPTAAQAALTTEKRNATRKARGTTSKKQKSTIHGTVPTTTTAASTATTAVTTAAVKTGS